MSACRNRNGVRISGGSLLRRSLGPLDCPSAALGTLEKVCVSGERWRHLWVFTGQPPTRCFRRDAFLPWGASVRTLSLGCPVIAANAPPGKCVWGGDLFEMERCFLQALPTHSGESMTMLQFPWRPGDCMLTFGPGNSLQLLGTTAKLPLIMRGENTRLRGENQLLFQKLAPLLVLNCKKVREKPHGEDAEGPAGALAAVRFRWDPLDSSVCCVVISVFSFPERKPSFRMPR